MNYTLEQIQDRFKQGEKLEYLFFWGHQASKDGRIIKSCLSQWWMTNFKESDIIFKSAEHYMMVGKARVFNDLPIVDQIVAAESPKKVKP